MKLKDYDIYTYDNKTFEERNHKNNFNEDNLPQEFINDYREEDEEEDNSLGEKTNPNWTLRKSSAKILDKFSNWWPKWTIENSKHFLEVELQNTDDWVIKYFFLCF